jgi:metal-responsive CopG/Arc/MetJ family transcriptional regulator
MPSRSADRHNPDKQTGVYARLDNADVDRLDVVRAKLGIHSRRQAIITAIREFLDRHENGEDPK